MTGGELQLKAYGSENIYLNANPQISFFRSAFKRHTNFAMENYTITYNGTSSMTEASNTLFTFNIKRYGDLLGPIFFVMRLPNIYSSNEQQFKYIKNLGATLIERATLYISGQKICEIQGDTINNYHRLCCNYPTNLNYNEMIGHTPAFYNPTMLDPVTGNLVYRYSINNTNPSIVGADLYIPIPFFFTNNSGLYLPLIGLQRSEVVITVETRRLSDLYTIRESIKTQPLYGKRIRPNLTNQNQSIYNFIKGNEVQTAFAVHMEAQYVFLDNDERQQFSSLPNEYLIQQVQYKPFLGIVDNRIIDMYFFHPTKEMRFMLRKTDAAVNFNEWTNYGNNDTWGENFLEGTLANSVYRSELDLNGIREQLYLRINDANNKILRRAKFLMNGQDRTRDFFQKYWESVQVFQYHLGSTAYPFGENDFFNVFSYGLEPDNFQPSGSANLTNLKSYQLDITTRLPPNVRNWLIAYYVLNLSNPTISSSWRNPNYSNIAFIDNVFQSFFGIYSLETTPNQKRIYGSYTTNTGIYNVLLAPVQYQTTPYGTILNNKITLTGATMTFYALTDVNFITPLSTVSVVSGEVVLVYIDKPVNIERILNFMNLQVAINTYNLYFTNLSNQQFVTLMTPVNSQTGQLYTGTYRSLDNMIDDEITRQISMNDEKNLVQYNNTFTLVTVDFVNFKIYGKYNLIQTVSINGAMTNVKTVYNCIINFQNNNRDGTYYIIPLTGNVLWLYPENDLNFTTPISNFPQQLLPLSSIIFQIIENSTINPDDLRNYLWRYDLYIEAHNYNLLRVVNGEGSVAYST